MKFEERIKLVRTKLKETQSEFGKRFGVGGVAVSLWESGDRKAPHKVLYFLEEFLRNWKVCDKCNGTGWVKENKCYLR